ncbi:MAG TPA: ATP-binding protein [Methanospirillum sp.]|nr:ATP-binding protein [Methanospirillum sp.]
MFLRTLLVMVLILAVVSSLSMGLVVWYGQYTMAQLDKEEKPVLELIQSITKLRNLQFDYLVSQENRTLTQWKLVYNQSMNHTSSLIADEENVKTRIERINRAFKSLKILFDAAVRVPVTRSGEIQPHIDENFSFGYNLLNQQSLNAFDELSQMEQMIREKKLLLRERIDLITNITFMVITFITILSILILFRRITRSFYILEKGTRILGSGDLTHHIAMIGNDEFGNLAHSFNNMANDLQKVLISRDHLQEAKQIAEAANHSKSIFLANMSHELRTPLNAILGFSQLLRQKPGLTQSELSQINIINRSGEHLLTIINDILDMAKIEAGKITISSDVFDLHLLITGIFDLFSLQAAEQGISYNLDLPLTIPRFICSDESKIRQILINLISNAIKFTPSGGIQIRVRSKIPYEINPPNNEDTDESASCHLIIEVIDSGIGISKDACTIIFEPFEQISDGRKKAGGTGLGLAISKKFAEILGGSLMVTSSGVKGEGSTFTFDIPYKPVTDEMCRNPVKGFDKMMIADTPIPYRILIVDDQEENCELLASFHQRLGIPSRMVFSGEEAIDCFRKWHPHLIWMDIRMPGIRGDEALRIIRKEDTENQTLIIAVTACSSEDQRTHHFMQEFDGFLQKPYTLQEVIALLREMLHIEFIPRSREESVSDIVSCKLTDSIDLQAIDPELKICLIKSAEQGNITHIYQDIENIRRDDPSAADLIQQYADTFDFAGIITLLSTTGNK